jgi:hypothetical protein
MESVLRQTHRNLEVIAIDDGSSDASRAILQSFAERDSRVQVISRENKGLVATLNEGLDLAKGEFVARMDADDICYPGRFTRQLQAFAADPALTVCGMSADLLWSENRVAVQQPESLNWQEVRILNIFGPALFHPVIMFKRQHFLEKGFRYRPDYKHAEDFDLLRRVTRHCRALVLPEKGLIYRDHGHGNVSTVHRQEQTKAHFKIVGEQLESFCIGVPYDALVKLTTSIDPTEEDIESVSAFFRGLRSYDGFSGIEDRAFKVGMTRLLWQVHSVLAGRVGPYPALKMVRRTGIVKKMPRRFAVGSLCSRLLGTKAAVQVNKIVSLVERRRTFPLNDILSRAGLEGR